MLNATADCTVPVCWVFVRLVCVLCVEMCFISQSFSVSSHATWLLVTWSHQLLTWLPCGQLTWLLMSV